MRVFESILRSACAALTCLALGCGRTAPQARPAAGVPELVATPIAIEAPPQSDAVPLWSLAFVYEDGTRVPVDERAIGYTAFRDGAALINRERELLLISPDGARRTLATRSATTPVRGAAGELYYVALYGAVAELHRLSEAGDDRVIARELSNVALIAPQADTSVLLVGARNGGVAGMWRVAQGSTRARCLTNCELTTGEGWQEGKDRFVPPPGTVVELEAAYRTLLTTDSEHDTLGGKP